MSKRTKKIQKQLQSQNKLQGASMSQTTINPEAESTKPQSEGQASVKEKAKTVFSVTMEKIKTTVVGGLTFAKESVLAAWNGALQYYKNVRKNIAEKGILKWFTDGFRQNAYGFLKFSLKATAFALIHNLIVNATGFSIINPYFLLSILAIAVGLSIYSSVKAQKEVLGTVSVKSTSAHILNEMSAA